MLLEHLKISSDKRDRVGRRGFLPEWWRYWLTRFLIAVPGCAFALYGIGGPATAYSRIWHAYGLPFFLFAATLSIWRAPEPSLPSALRWRELQRKVCRRAGVALVFGAMVALIAYRWSMWNGDSSAAGEISVAGLVMLLLSPIPPLLDPLLWRAWPMEVRRVVRAADFVKDFSELARAVTAEIDPERGAAGRPRPLAEYGGGAPRAEPASVSAKPTRGRSPATVTWDGHRLDVIDGFGRTRTIPLAPLPSESPHQEARDRRPAVELVCVSNRGPRSIGPGRANFTTLFFLDEKGYRVLSVTYALCTWPAAIKLAKAAGLSFAAYDLDYRPERCDEICADLFPPRLSSRRI